MKKFICKKKCFWGPQPGTETLYEKDSVILATGAEPGIDEFFVAADPEEAPARGKGKKAQADIG